MCYLESQNFVHRYQSLFAQYIAYCKLFLRRLQNVLVFRIHWVIETRLFKKLCHKTEQTSWKNGIYLLNWKYLFWIQGFGSKECAPGWKLYGKGAYNICQKRVEILGCHSSCCLETCHVSTYKLAWTSLSVADFFPFKYKDEIRNSSQFC